MADRYVCPQCGQDHIRRARRDQATPEPVRRRVPWALAWAIAFCIALWLFVLGMLVPTVVRWVGAF